MKYLLATLIALVWLGWTVVYIAYAQPNRYGVPEGYVLTDQGLCGFPDGSALPCAKFEKEEHPNYCYCTDDFYIAVASPQGEVLGVVHFEGDTQTVVWRMQVRT